MYSEVTPATGGEQRLVLVDVDVLAHVLRGALADVLPELLPGILGDALGQLGVPQTGDDAAAQPAYLTVQQLADATGNKPSWVRSHAERLGGFRRVAGEERSAWLFPRDAVDRLPELLAAAPDAATTETAELHVAASPAAPKPKRPRRRPDPRRHLRGADGRVA